MTNNRKELSPKSRRVILWVADQLRDGYTGEISLECHEGGVRRIRWSGSSDPDMLEDLQRG